MPAGIVFIRLIVVAIVIFTSGCAHYQKISHEKKIAFYDTSGTIEDPHRAITAPVFLIYNYQDPFNRIGTPAATIGPEGQEDIYIDHSRATVYVMKRKFSTAKGSYTNLFYRVHFPGVPYSLIPFHLTAGQNSGLMVVLTLNASDQVVLVTTVHTCGCYLAIIPTSYLPEANRPIGWRNTPLRVYGEQLPGQLDYKGMKDPRLMIHLRPATHRVMNLEITEDNIVYGLRDPFIFRLRSADMKMLEKIPLNGRSTSFFYQGGPLKGHVKGSIKPFESILLGLISLDLFVGSDKIYADSVEGGNTFYTSLKPWNREASDMWEFEKFLIFWGWRL